MTNYEKWLEIVSDVTRVSPRRILMRYGRQKQVEARQLYILLLSRKGFSPARIAIITERALNCVYACRHHAEWLYGFSTVFKMKYDKIEKRIHAAEQAQNAE